MDLDKIERSVKLSRIIVIFVFVVTFVSFIGWFFFYLEQPLSHESQMWGAFGDFVGGLLNPLVAYSAFYWLTVSVIVQKKELAETTRALSNSSLSQEKQVKETYRSSEITVIKMELNKISIEIESEYSYRNNLALNSDLLVDGRVTNRANGLPVPIMEEFESCDFKIRNLKIKQKRLLNKAQALLDDT
jgi:hypothetical protein